MGAVIAAVGAAAGWTATTTALVQVGAGITLSALASQRIRQAQRGSSVTGVRSDFGGAGQVTPQSLLIGDTATYGFPVCPYYSDGETNVPNVFRYQIIALAAVPINALKQVILGDHVLEYPGDFIVSGNGYLTPNATVHDGIYQDNFYINFYDGTQTAADPLLVGKFTAHPERPWTNQNVLTGMPYASCIYRYVPDLWQGEPQPLFVVEGAKLYDWRKDSTNGGTGTHRWNDQTTWEFSNNLIVAVYNIKRGFPLPDGDTFGPNVEAADLPVDNWTVAADRAQSELYRGGYDIRMGTAEYGGETPFDAIDTLLLSAEAEVMDAGGTWYVQCTKFGIPSATISDNNVLRSTAQAFDPFLSRDDIFNVIRPTHVAADKLWRPNELESYEDNVSIAEIGERRVLALNFPASPEYRRVQKLSQRYLQNGGRARQNDLGITHDFAHVAPFDSILWTSGRHNYNNKQMEVTRLVIEAETLLPYWHVKELDPTGYNGPGEQTLTFPSNDRITLAPYVFDTFSLASLIRIDPDGQQTAGGILVSWPALDSESVNSIDVQFRPVGTLEALTKTFSRQDVLEGSGAITDGVALRATPYEVRLKLNIPNIRTDWSAWQSVDTADTRIQAQDLAPDATQASRLDVSPFDNVFKDEDMIDDDFWNSADGTFSFQFTTVEQSGRRLMRIPASADFQSVGSGWQRVTPGAEYRAELGAWLLGTAGDGAVSALIQTVPIDNAGQPLTGAGQNEQHPILSAETGNSVAFYNSTFRVGTDQRWARFIMIRPGGGGSIGTFAGPKLYLLPSRERVSSSVLTTEVFAEQGVSGQNYNVLAGWSTLCSVTMFKPTSASMTVVSQFEYTDAAFSHPVRITANGVLVKSFTMKASGTDVESFYRVANYTSTAVENVTFRLQIQAGAQGVEAVTLEPREMFATHNGS